MRALAFALAVALAASPALAEVAGHQVPTSVGYGLHQTSHFKQFTATGVGGLWLGGLYIATDYDLEKAIAAHTYYDIVAFGLSGLYPTRLGNNVFGIRYRF